MKLTLSHKYSKNTSTSGVILTEYLLDAGRRPQTSEKARKSQRNWVRKKKKKERKELGQDLSPWEGGVKEERFLHQGKPPHWQGDRPGQKVSFRASEESVAAGLW